MGQSPQDSGSLIGFGGPIQLSGYALSKQFLLKTMDNYIQFMSDQLNLFSENVQMYSVAIQNSADNEQAQIQQQANSEMVSGISSVLQAGFSIGLAYKMNSKNTSLSEEEGQLKTSEKNLDEVHDLLDAANEGGTGGLEARRRRLATGPGRRRIPERVISRLSSRKSLDLLEEHGTGPAGKSRSYKEAIERLALKRDRATTPAEREECQGHIDKAIEAVRKRKKAVQQKLLINSQKKTANSTDTNSWQQMGQSVIQGLGGFVKYDLGQSQGTAKNAAVYAQGNTQVNQSILSTTEKTAQDMKQHSEDLISLARQISQNNVSRG